MPGLDSNTKLLLHCDGTDGSTTFTDVSDSAHTVNVTATAEVDTAQSKWGGASALFDGDSGYFDIDDSADWDVAASAADSWTIDFQVRHTDHVDYEIYIKQAEDGSNYWQLFHHHGDGIQFTVATGGSTILTTNYGGEITDTNWHHVAMCKVASKYGVYLDGTQVCYVDDSSTDNYIASLYIGTNEVPNAFFDGHMDEIRIQHSNYFGAAPANAFGNGETPDTITVPPSSYARDLSINVHDCGETSDIVVGG